MLPKRRRLPSLSGSLRTGGKILGHELINAPWADKIATLAVLIAGIALAEWGSRAGIISPFVLPAPSSVASVLIAGFRSGTFIDGIVSTLVSTVLGFAIAAFSAFAIGGILVAFNRIERIFYPFIVAFQALPKIAIAPLVIIWLGLGGASKLIIVTIVCFFPILVNTMQGLRLRDRERQELAMALGASKWQIFRFIRVPGSLPYVFAGLRVAAVFALIGSITAEFVGARSGLGVILIEQKALFNVPAVFAVLVILMIIGLLLNVLMAFAERRLTFWARNHQISKAEDEVWSVRALGHTATRVLRERSAPHCFESIEDTDERHAFAICT